MKSQKLVQQNQHWFKVHRKKIIGGAITLSTIVLLPFAKDVLTFEYQNYRKEIVTTQVKHVESDIKPITQNKLEKSSEELANSINELSENWRKSYSELQQKYVDTLTEQKIKHETFAYLEGNDAENNYGVFLESYYGLNGRTKLGRLSVDDLVGQQVRWALKLDKIHLDEKTNLTFATFVPIEPLCSKGECPENYDDILLVQLCKCDETTTFLKETRVGDFVHLEGDAFLVNYESNDIEYRHRLTLKISAYRYRVSK